MATLQLNASMGSNPLISAGATGAGGNIVTQLNGLHSLGEGMTQPGIVLVVSITAYTSGSLTVMIQGVSGSGYIYPSAAGGILSSAALGAAAVTSLSIGAGLPVTSNVSANVLVPNALLITATCATTPVFTYGIDYCIAV